MTVCHNMVILTHNEIFHTIFHEIFHYLKTFSFNFQLWCADLQVPSWKTAWNSILMNIKKNNATFIYKTPRKSGGNIEIIILSVRPSACAKLEKSCAVHIF